MTQTELSPRRGILLALASAATFGSITTLASLAYQDGTSPLALIFVRFFSSFLVFAAACLLLRRRLAIGGRAWLSILPLTLAWLVSAIGYLGSVQTLPVSLAAILFFTFPVIVAVCSWVIERRWPRPLEALLFILAFCGLVFAIGPSFTVLDPIGLLLAMFGAAGAAAIFLTGRLALARTDSLVALVHLNAINSIAVLALGLALGALAFPDGGFPLGQGWSALLAATLLFVFAVFFQLNAIGHAGPERSAMFFNLEPVVTLAIAMLLLGERLSAQQLLGGAMVIAALLLFSWQSRRLREG